MFHAPPKHPPDKIGESSLFRMRPEKFDLDSLQGSLRNGVAKCPPIASGVLVKIYRERVGH
jgi:hypothetical protein